MTRELSISNALGRFPLAAMEVGVSGHQTSPFNSKALTHREVEILTLIGHGKTTKQIAVLLSIRANTVGNHRKHICQKLDLHSTTELASYAALHLLASRSRDGR